MPKRWYQALAAAAASFVPYLAGWRGTDWAAHVYRAGEVAHNGLALWDPGWYAGTFPLGYSLLYSVLAAYLGAWPVALASAAVSAYCFDALLSRGSGGYRSLSSCYFALSTVVEVAIGQLPTLAAEAFGLGCVLCLSRRWAGQADRGQTARAWRAVALGIGVGLGMLAGLTSPVAGVFVALSLGAWGLSIATEPGHQLLDRRAVTLAGAGVAVLAATLALPLLFPTPGYFPFLGGDLVAVLAVCALLACPWLRAARPVRAGALLYALASVVFFVVPTTMGDNDIRFAAYIGVPLVLYYLPGATSRLISTGLRRPSAAAASLTVVALLVGWHWAPVASAVGGAANGPSSGPAFYQPLIDELTSLTGDRPVRIEIPPTAHHWESAYVAPYFPLARGWERQLDIAYDPLFYRPTLLPGAYRSWLLSEGVSYVALANAPLDYSATAEAALLRSGSVPGLAKVWATASWELWKVEGSPGLASGAARVTALKSGEVAVHFSTAGWSLVRVRWSRYWSLVDPPAGPACAEPGPGGWTWLGAARPGTVELGLAVVGATHGQCDVPDHQLATGAGAPWLTGGPRPLLLLPDGFSLTA